MRIAIIGSGISGLVAAYQLSDLAEVTVFEANDYIGGHTHTVDAEATNGRFAVDTGFIVFNDRTYPNFCRLIERLNVHSDPTDMSFGLVCEGSGLEYGAPQLAGLFAQRQRIFQLTYLRMLADIVRFNRHARQLLRAPDMDRSLRQLFQQGRYGELFLDRYLIPMMSAIWSADPEGITDLPAHYFLHFFENHGLLSLKDRPQWRVIRGGSKQYIEPLTRTFESRIRLQSPVASIRRYPYHVEITGTSREPENFDHVVIATHSDQALRMLSDPTEREREVLGAIPYQANDVTLHTDTRVLPQKRAAWASWNYRVSKERTRGATLTYNMNRLQRLDAAETFCVSLNQHDRIDAHHVQGRFTYHHPVYGPDMLAAQRRHAEISGHNRTHYCGAYWGYGFHEDGVNSALAACSYFDRGRIR